MNLLKSDEDPKAENSDLPLKKAGTPHEAAVGKLAVLAVSLNYVFSMSSSVLGRLTSLFSQRESK